MKFKKIGIFSRFFGCRHETLSSRPITIRDESYRVCTRCGARRKFDPKTFKMSGGFYFETVERRND